MIGVFDSGIGGLSVLREIHRQCPAQPTLYFADQANIPYGPRSKAEIEQFSVQICRYLIGRGAKIIVVACNTATAAAIDLLRDTFPAVPFVGMEPAIKPAAKLTRSGKIGVMATAGTFKSQRYGQLMRRYAQNTQLFQSPCVGLVEQIESGQAEKALLESFIRPMLAKEIDTLILGCTHYPFALPLIRQIVGEQIPIIDPAPAVARQTQRLLDRLPNDNKKIPLHEYVTSGELTSFIPMVKRLLAVGFESADVGQNSAQSSHHTFYQFFDNNPSETIDPHFKKG